MEWLAGYDLGILYWFGPLHRPWLDPVAKVVSAVGDPWTLAGIGLVLALGLLLRSWRCAAGLVIVGLLSYGADYGVKRLVMRPRPDVAWRQVPMPYQPSFPSGHALRSMAILTTAGFLYGSLLGARWLGAVGILLSLAIGLTRPYLGVHYPLDVIAGWVGGLALALIATPLIVGRETPRRPPSSGTTPAPPT